MTTFSILRNEREAIAFTAGETIFRAGEPGDVMYAVLEGLVDIVIHDQVIETVGEGGILGEMALIDTKPRSASAVAKTDCKLAAVNQKRFFLLIQQTPFFAIQVMEVMAERLRRWGELAR